MFFCQEKWVGPRPAGVFLGAALSLLLLSSKSDGVLFKHMTLGGFGRPLMALSSSDAWEAYPQQLHIQTPDQPPLAAVMLKDNQAA